MPKIYTKRDLDLLHDALVDAIPTGNVTAWDVITAMAVFANQTWDKVVAALGEEQETPATENNRQQKPSEVVFPELKHKPEYLSRDCPECGNTRFKILETIKKAEGGKSGRYRVECATCSFKEMAISKNNYLTDNPEPKKGKVGRRPGAE